MTKHVTSATNLRPWLNKISESALAINSVSSIVAADTASSTVATITDTTITAATSTYASSTAQPPNASPRVKIREPLPHQNSGTIHPISACYFSVITKYRLVTPGATIHTSHAA